MESEHASLSILQGWEGGRPPWVTIKWVVVGTGTACINRHDAIRDTVFFATQSTALAPQIEALSLISVSSSCLGDIFLPNRCWGCPAALDVIYVVICTPQSATHWGAAYTLGFALLVDEQRKIAVHNEACQAKGVSFIPLVAESLGGWSEEAIHNITRSGHILGQLTCTGTSADNTIWHRFQRLFASLWRRNAILCLTRIPAVSAWIDVKI